MSELSLERKSNMSSGSSSWVSTLLVHRNVKLHLMSHVVKSCYRGKLFPHLVTHQAGEHFMVSVSAMVAVIVHVTSQGRVSGNYTFEW